MMAGDELMTIGSAGAISGVAILRVAWGRSHRSAALNAAGWILLLGGVGMGWLAAGAWGSSVISLTAMTAAFVALAGAATLSTPTTQKASNRRVRMLPERGEPPRIGARLTTFTLVVPIAALLAIGLAIALRELGRLAGWGAANSTLAALMLTPLAWTAIAFSVLMQTRRRTQFKILLAASLPVWPALAIGILG